MMKKTCLVIPCYNEEGRLRLSEFEKYLNDFEMLFVNDGSKDNTKQLLSNFCQNHKNASFLNLEKNKGKAEAVRQGVLKALEKEYDFIGYWDADLATPFSELELFENVAEQSEMDFIMGSRFKRLGAKIERKMHRHYLGRIFATFASMALNLGVYDTQCGAKFIRSSVAKEIFSLPFISYWLFDVELIFRFMKLKHQGINHLYEIPLRNWKDVEGSKLKLKDFLKAPLELIRMYFHYRVKSA